MHDLMTQMLSHVMVRSTGNTNSVKMRHALLASADLTLVHPTATKESEASDSYNDCAA